VADGKVTDVEGLDESARAALRNGFRDLVPTLATLVREVDTG